MRNSWGHRLSGDSLAVSARTGARCISLRLIWCLSLDTEVVRARPRSRWLGRKARLQVKQQSDAVTPSKLGPLSREGQNRNHPLYSLESSGHKAGKQKTPPLTGNKVKPDDTDKVTETCHAGQKCQSRHSLKLPRTDIHVWARQMQLSGLASEGAEGRFAIRFAMHNNTALCTH